jgi:hypothetical protein
MHPEKLLLAKLSGELLLPFKVRVEELAFLPSRGNIVV